MTKNDTTVLRQSHNAVLLFKVVVIIAGFTIALLMLPLELFFVVAVIIIAVLQKIEKSYSKNVLKQISMTPQQ